MITTLSLYGLSKYGLAFRIKSSVEEADEMLSEFFKGLPRINNFLKGMARFAVENLYSPEFVLGACRFVDRRKIYYDKGSVERTASNFGIQGSGASILKIATVLIRRHARQIGHKVHVANMPYDEILLDVLDENKEYWRVKLRYYMELAGRLAFKNDLLKADDCMVEKFWKH